MPSLWRFQNLSDESIYLKVFTLELYIHAIDLKYNIVRWSRMTGAAFDTAEGTRDKSMYTQLIITSLLHSTHSTHSTPTLHRTCITNVVT